MKRIVLALTLALTMICLFAIGASCAELSVDADELADIKTVIDEAQDGDSVTVNLTSDIVIPSTSDAIMIEKGITVTINFKGYTIFANPGSAGAGTVYGMYMDSNDARLILNGTSDVDPVNYVAPSDAKITASNGVINDPNEGTDVKSPDYASNGPAVVISSGSLELNNMYINQYNTGEWAIFYYHTKGESHVHNLKINNSIVRVPNSNSLYAIARRNVSGTVVSTVTQIENSVIYGAGGSKESLSFGKDSYMRNTRIATHKFIVDSWLATEGIASEPIEFENVIFENKNPLYLWTGKIFLNLIDCTFPQSYSIEIGGDTYGATKLIMTETATCTSAGRQAYSEAVKGAAEYITSFDTLEAVVEEYAAENPAKGHTVKDVTSVTYTNYCALGYYNGVCEVCGEEGAEGTASAPALIVHIGYTYTEDAQSGSISIAQGYKLNKDMLDYVDADIEYGMVAYINATSASVMPIGMSDAVAAQLTGGYEAFTIKISNIPNTSADVNIIFCAYVTENGKTYYLDNGQTNESLAGQSCTSLKTILGK